jgi:hypothetical protein
VFQAEARRWGNFEAQPALLRSLLVSEIEDRRVAGDPPHIERYLERLRH